ncbi:MAG: nuclear transport factor 2 family protein [Candidatus Sulfotelmatobacter sp.]
MHSRFVLYFFFFSACCLPIMFLATRDQALAQDTYNPYGDDGRAIERVLHKQQEAWNRHDLEGFMAGYWNSPQLTFFSGAKEVDGWQPTMDRYLATYSSPGHEMGKLEFSGLRVEVLGQDGAFVRGSWKLTMSSGKTPHGLFTLVFRKFPEGWKIVHDHTSTAE